MAGIEAICGFTGEPCGEQVEMGCGIQSQEFGATRPCLLANIAVMRGAGAALKKLGDPRVSLSDPKSPDPNTRLISFVIKTKKEHTIVGYYGVKNGAVIKEIPSGG